MQGRLNILNGLQDIAVGTGNDLFKQRIPGHRLYDLYERLHLRQPGTFFESPDWSRGLLTHEYLAKINPEYANRERAEIEKILEKAPFDDGGPNELEFHPDPLPKAQD